MKIEETIREAALFRKIGNKDKKWKLDAVKIDRKESSICAADGTRLYYSVVDGDEIKSFLFCDRWNHKLQDVSGREEMSCGGVPIILDIDGSYPSVEKTAKELISNTNLYPVENGFEIMMLLLCPAPGEQRSIDIVCENMKMVATCPEFTKKRYVIAKTKIYENLSMIVDLGLIPPGVQIQKIGIAIYNKVNCLVVEIRPGTHMIIVGIERKIL